MTWKKASPFLVVAIIFDVLRYMFLMFWFFGPALAALYCTIKVSAVVGTTIAATVCSAGAVVAGAAAVVMITAFGTVMAIATAFAGFLTIFLLLAIFNTRVFKEPTTLLWALVGLGISITVTVWRLHSAQIKVEKAAFEKWEKETAAARAKQKNQQMAQVIQMSQFRATQQQVQLMQQEQDEQQQVQLMQQEATNDDEYPQERDKSV